MRNSICNIWLLFFCFSANLVFSQNNVTPVVTASGNQIFCPGSPIHIVADFSITDADDTTIPDFFIQISSNYQINVDFLEVQGSHPNITQEWDRTNGKLTLKPASGSEMLLTDVENAVKDIVYTSSNLSIGKEKTFSFTIDDKNYLPLTDHFYEFVADERITWANAKVAAEQRTYFGRQGYLATLTSQEEADFAGKQASGAGWIGGSDEENEGVWKWVTGPEAGTVFWNGAVSGTTPNFAFWNRNEPNNFRGNEDYAHITDPNVENVIVGSWNDLPNEGGTGLYIPRGYIVEYGSSGDPPLNISASTRIYIPEILSVTNAEVCESGTATISAVASEGEILWHDNPNVGTQPELAVGNTFTVNNITETKIYYATIRANGCITFPRVPVTITVNERPTITNVTNDLICSGTAVLSANASSGDVYWYEDETSTNSIFIGSSYQTPNLTATRSYFVEANVSGCNSSTRTEVIAEVDSRIPQFNLLQDTFILCKDIGNVQLETINALDTYRYIWRKDGNLITGDLGSIEVSEVGNYSVQAVSQSGCISAEQFLTVRASEKATITKDDIIITDDSNNNSIQVANPNLGDGDYEFALDDVNGNYQDVDFFQNLSTGIHTLYIRDKRGCGVEEYQFSILIYPKFFTPNGDNENDFWQIDGYDKSFYTTSNIYIYNRFGNLIYTIEQNSQGWDGNYGSVKLPENTYWFRVVLTDINGYSIEKFGSISLIR